MEPPGFKRLRYRIEYAALSLLRMLVPLFPRMVCLRVSEWVGSVCYWVDGRGRAVALANLRAAFGEQYSDSQRRRIARASYGHFVRTMLELFWAPRLTRENFSEYITVRGTEAFERNRGKRGVVVLASHRAGFEWAGIGAAFLGNAGTALGESHKNPAVSRILGELRGVAGSRAIDQSFSVLRLMRAVARKEVVGFLIDLTVPPAQSSTVIEAFGLQMCVSLLPATLARRGGASLVHLFSEPQPDGKLEVDVQEVEIPADASDRAICQLCWNGLEERIRRRPETWLWAYKHWRFRPEDEPESRYPFYANLSSKFEKVRREAV